MNIPAHFADAVHLGDEPEAAALVLADWLDEHGDSDRARFVRLSVSLKLDPHGPGAAAASRERDWLWRACGERWAGRVPGRALIDTGAEFDAPLGVFRTVTARAEEAARLGSRLFDESEARGVELYAGQSPAWPSGVLDAIGRDRIARLVAGMPYDRGETAAVVGQLAPWPARLRALALELGRGGMGAAWASVPPPRGLRELALSGEGEVPDALACPEAWAAVESLSLLEVRPREPLVAVFQRLRRMSLEGVAPWQVVAGPEFAPNLQELAVLGEVEGDDDEPDRRLGDWLNGLRLGRLELTHASPTLAMSRDVRVADLSFSRCPDFPPGHWRSLLAWPGLAEVRRLRLSVRIAEDAFLTDLARGTRGGVLESLTCDVARSVVRDLLVLRDGLEPGQLGELALNGYPCEPETGPWPALGAARSALRDLRSLRLLGVFVPATVAVGWLAELPLGCLTVGSLANLDAATAGAIARSPTLRVVEFQVQMPHASLTPPGFRRTQDAWIRLP